ncbi:MAG: hypothetical protein CMQ49_04195 [Gammaproteobacteria bacterium]|nr:hypothetical protein [Gammaproteobacteria bacterium]
MLKGFVRQSEFARLLAAAAVLLLFAGQTVAALHFHEDAAEPACVVCASTQQDDEAIAVKSVAQTSYATVLPCTPAFEITPGSVYQPPQRARAPPAH